MEALDIHNELMRSPHSFFKNALTFFNENQFDKALQSIDAAIIFSNNSPFYIYQKIRFLYHLNATSLDLIHIDPIPSCSSFIVSQLEYLYKHGSLYILCRCIDYLQKLESYNLDGLKQLLQHHHIPYCLAQCYNTLVTQKDKPFLKLAQKAMVQDDYLLCLNYCELYLKLHPTSSQVCYLQAYSHHMLGHLLTAKNYYLNYLDLQPQSAKAYTNIALISMELGNYDLAISYFQKAIALDSDNVDYLLYLGECYYNSKKLDAAIATYKQAIKCAPNHLQSYFNLSHTYKKMSKLRHSKRYIKLIQKQLKTRKCRRSCIS